MKLIGAAVIPCFPHQVMEHWTYSDQATHRVVERYVIRNCCSYQRP